MERIALAVLLGALSAMALAQSQPHVLRKCVDAKGGVSYQNAACPAGSREASAREYRPEADVAYDANSAARKIEADRQAIRRGNAASQSGRSRNPVGASIGLSRDQNRCEAAKRKRQAAFDRNWRHRSGEFSRRWDDYVRQECK